MPTTLSATKPSLKPSVQRCLRCARELAELDPRTECPYCGGLLELRHPLPAERGAALAARFRASPSRSGVWRFAPVVLPSVADATVSWPEGNTPLIARRQVAAWAGVPALQLKHEGLNPTGSFKDRGMTVGVTQAVRVGATAVACATTGNTGASLASYAALAGLPALVLVPVGKVAIGKLTQSLAYGARTLLVRGDFDDCLRLVREASEELGVYLLNSVNPFRIEGQKTIVLEMLEQLGWEPPDWIALPAGNLGNTAAFGKALREALELGLISRLPRLLAVQSDGAAPFAMSFREGFRVRHRVRANTIATAINIGAPASYQRAVQSIRETDGVVTSVSDDAIMDAKAVIDGAGVGCEPASAASVAGVRQLVQAGTIAAGARVVCVLTGHVLKDPESLDRYHRGTEPPPAHANRPLEIDATVSAVAAVMRALRDS
jgi:threonine synthase